MNKPNLRGHGNYVDCRSPGLWVTLNLTYNLIPQRNEKLAKIQARETAVFKKNINGRGGA